jgi:hypothetical protein
MPVIEMHEGIYVVRDDMVPGGTKGRFAHLLYEDTDELVYASPPEGGAQTALSLAAKKLGKRLTLFTAARSVLHPRTETAIQNGANVVFVRPGYLNVVQSRAKAYVNAQPEAKLLNFGLASGKLQEAIIRAATQVPFMPDQVWVAAGSGTICRALRKAWPEAIVHAVQVGHRLTSAEVGGAAILAHPMPFAKPYTKDDIPFDADLHYDAKAYALCRQLTSGYRKGKILFWNCAASAETEKARTEARA